MEPALLGPAQTIVSNIHTYLSFGLENLKDTSDRHLSEVKHYYTKQKGDANNIADFLSFFVCHLYGEKRQ